MTVTPRTPDLTARGHRLAALFADELDGFIAVDPANVRWLTGLAGEGHVLYGNTPLLTVVGPHGSRELVVHASEMGWLDERLDTSTVHTYGRFYFEGRAAKHIVALRDQRELAVALAEALDAAGAGARIGIDDGVPATLLFELGPALAPRRLQAAARVALRARRIKDDHEVSVLRRANETAEDSIFAALDCARPGSTELELLAQVRIAMIERGARPMLGSVGISERGALVDTSASNRELRRGDVIRFDVGCTVDGYHADLARTAVLAPADQWIRDAYAALLHGEQAAIEAIRPGVTSGEVFEVAIAATRAGGLADYYRSHCGHGIGLQIYEPPLIAPGGDEPLETGMTLCVETPLYVLGRAGLQVEDAVIVMPDGAERLGRAPQLLAVIA